MLMKICVLYSFHCNYKYVVYIGIIKPDTNLYTEGVFVLVSMRARQYICFVIKVLGRCSVCRHGCYLLASLHSVQYKVSEPIHITWLGTI